MFFSFILRNTLYRHCANIDWKKYDHWCDGFMYGWYKEPEGFFFFQTNARFNNPYRDSNVSGDLIQMTRWLKNNIKSYNWMVLVKYVVDIQHDHDLYVYDFHFRKKSDAIMFKLRWG